MGVARAVVVVAVAVLALPSITGAQGLGDASKKEKARREQTKAPKAKTYTQEDLAALPPVANEPTSAAGEGAPAGASLPAPSRGEEAPPSASGEPIFREEGSSPVENAQGNERLWRGRVAQARARVERARQKHQTLAGLNLVPGYEYQDERGRTVIGSVEQLQGMTAAAKAELDAAEKALADLLEEARRASVPPGWLR